VQAGADQERAADDEPLRTRPVVVEVEGALRQPPQRIEHETDRDRPEQQLAEWLAQDSKQRVLRIGRACTAPGSGERKPPDQQVDGSPSHVTRAGKPFEPRQFRHRDLMAKRGRPRQRARAIRRCVNPA
jgi:hypothetical protein